MRGPSTPSQLSDAARRLRSRLAQLVHGRCLLHGALAHGKDAVLVRKDERRTLYQDGPGLWRTLAPQRGQSRSRDGQWWDREGLLSWPQVAVPLRVVRSVESWQVRSQLDGNKREQASEWVWVTTVASPQAPTARVLRRGPQRGDIENQGCNELVNSWPADHADQHEPGAIETFLLTVLLACNLFHAFLARHLKPTLRRGTPKVFWPRVMAGELYPAATAVTYPSSSP